MWPFNKKETPVKLGDKVWMTKQKKYEHLIADAMTHLKEGKIVLLCYYFVNTGEYLSKALQAGNYPFDVLDNVRPDVEDKINLLKAEYLREQYYLDRLSLGTREVIILFSEHYPLYKPEQELIESISSLGNHVSYYFYAAFDEPLLTMYGAEKVRGILETIGLKEDEDISSPLITGSINLVQKKIEAQVRFEIRSFSLEEWFENNLQGGLPR